MPPQHRHRFCLHSRWRLVFRRVATLFPLVLLAFAFVQDAAGHAVLEETRPAQNQILPEQPDYLEIIFNEPVSPVERQFRLFDSSESVTTLEPDAVGNSARVPLTDELADGSYVLAWRVISADGHPIGGALAFAIGAESTGEIVVSYAETDPLGRANVGDCPAIAYASLLAVVGLVFFHLFIARIPTIQSHLPTVLALIAVAALAISIPLMVARQQARAPGYVADIGDWANEARTVNWVTLGFATMGLAILLIAARRTDSTTRRVALANGAVLALGSISVIGHTRIVHPEWLIVASNVTHTIAGAVWLGGLVGLVTAFRTARNENDSDSVELAGAVARFSSVAAIALIGVLVSGTLSAGLILRSFSPLWSTNYGRLLIIKVTLVLIVIGIATWNRFRLVSTITRQPDEYSAWGLFRKLVFSELVLLILVVGVTGFLVNLSPREAASSQTDEEIHLMHEPIRINLVMGGTIVTGELMHIVDRTYSVQLWITDSDGDIVIPEDDPRVTITLESLDVGPIPIVLSPSGSGAIYSGTVDFPFSGAWTVAMSIRISTFESANGQVSVIIP